MIKKKAFGEYCLYIIENSNGMSVSLCDLGASVQSLMVPDKDGKISDVVLGYDTPEEYLSNDGYLGATVGRYANRIKGAEFSLNGKTYKLTTNEGKNTLHGGEGLSRKRFNASAEENAVTFSISDPDGADGFPGNLKLSVRYELKEDNTLIIDYNAVSDADTVLNVTNHSYFNLRGEGNVLSHWLKVNAAYFLPIDEELIPTGDVAELDGTIFDFQYMRPVQEDYYDICYVLTGNSYLAAQLYDEESRRCMSVFTDMPGLQVYAGGQLSQRRGKNGAVYGKNSGICLETQLFPDSPNHPDFPMCTLYAGEPWHSRTFYKFSIV